MPLLAPDRYYSTQRLAALYGITVDQMNDRLWDLGFVEWLSGNWYLTPAGQPYALFSMGRTIYWRPSICRFLIHHSLLEDYV